MLTRLLNKKFVAGLICLILLSFLCLLAARDYFNLKENSKNYTANAVDTISRRIETLFVEINSFPGTAANDILFLSGLSSLNNLIRETKVQEKKSFEKELESDLLRFIKENPAYYQLFYVDEYGDEVVKVEISRTATLKLNGQYKIITKNELQNRRGQYYFGEAIKLEEGEVLISEIDLSTKDGELENRGTQEFVDYIPILTYATTVFDKNNKRAGIMVANVYADYFLEDIRSFQGGGELTFLVNQDGYYITHPDESKEFGNLTGSGDNFLDDYPDISEKILFDYQKRQLRDKNSIFTYRHIHPSEGSFEIYRGFEKVFGKSPEKDFYWVLVNVSEDNYISKTIGNLEKRFLLFFVFCLFVIFSIIGLICLLISKKCK